MESAIIGNSLASNQIPNWHSEVAGETDPNNREIVAYQLGRKDGIKEEKENFVRLYLANVEICCYYSTRVHDFITDSLKFECKLATLKPVSVAEFTTLFIIPFECYKDKSNRKKLYKLANEFRQLARSKEIELEFIFMPESSDIDYESIQSDGFHWKYKKDEQNS